MDTAQVTFTQHYSDMVNTKYGTKTKNTFITDDDVRYETWKAPVAAVLAANMDTPITILFDKKVSTGKEGQVYTNLEIKDVLGTTNAPAADVAVSAPVAAPPKKDDSERQTQIMRQSALERAIRAFAAAGLDPVTYSAELLELSDDYLDYFINGRSED